MQYFRYHKFCHRFQFCSACKWWQPWGLSCSLWRPAGHHTCLGHHWKPSKKTRGFFPLLCLTLAVALMRPMNYVLLLDSSCVLIRINQGCCRGAGVSWQVVPAGRCWPGAALFVGWDSRAGVRNLAWAQGLSNPLCSCRTGLLSGPKGACPSSRQRVASSFSFFPLYMAVFLYSQLPA